MEDFSPYYDIFDCCMVRAERSLRPFMKKSRERTKKSRIMKGVAAAVIIAAFFCAGNVYATQNSIVTQVFFDEKIETVRSLSTDPEAIVKKAGCILSEGDALILDYFHGKGDLNVILVLRPFNVEISRDGKPIKNVYAAGTVGDIISKAGITLLEGDSLSLNKNEAVIANCKIDIISGFPVTVVADGSSLSLGFPGGTVKEALEKAEIEYDTDDEISPSIDTIIDKETRITVKRVEYREERKTKEVSFKKETIYSDELYKDESKVIQQGEKGEKTLLYTVKYINGEKVDSKKISSVITKEPTDKIVVKGTKERSRSYVYGTRVFSEIEPPYEIELDETNRPVEYKKLITGKATAYCGGGITATGETAMPGRIAVDPKQIPYGTKMYIVSSDGKYVYGYCIASDTGGFVQKKSAIADLYMHSYDDCIQFGRRDVDIYILE